MIAICYEWDILVSIFEMSPSSSTTVWRGYDWVVEPVVMNSSKCHDLNRQWVSSSFDTEMGGAGACPVEMASVVIVPLSSRRIEPWIFGFPVVLCDWFRPVVQKECVMSTHSKRKKTVLVQMHSRRFWGISRSGRRDVSFVPQVRFSSVDLDQSYPTHGTCTASCMHSRMVCARPRSGWEPNHQLKTSHRLWCMMWKSLLCELFHEEKLVF